MIYARILLIGLMVNGFLFTSAQAVQDTQNFIIEIDETDSLLSIIDRICERRSYHFAYAPDLLKTRPAQCGLFQAPTIDSLFSLMYNGILVCKRVAKNGLLLREETTMREAQPKQIALNGRISDAHTGEPIPDALIYIDSVYINTITDERGIFSLSMQVQHLHLNLHIKAITYREIIISASEVDKHFAVSLIPDPLIVDNIVVITEMIPTLDLSGKDLSLTFHRDHFTKLNTNSFAGKDVFRTVQMLPGVAAHDDLSSEIKIRGSEGQETLILLDGIPIYHADHYYGIFSAINANFLDNVSLYKNGLPVEYGGKTGGMLKMSGPSITPTAKVGLDANLFSTSLDLQLPLGPNSSIFLSGRKSYKNTINNKVFDFNKSELNVLQNTPLNITRKKLIDIQPQYNFYDINAKLLLHPGTSSTMDINLFLSNDQSKTNYNANFTARRDSRKILIQETFKQRESWRNTGGSLNYNLTLPNQWTIESNTYFSHHKQVGTVSSTLQRQFTHTIKTNGFTNAQQNEVTDWGGHLLIKNRSIKNGLKMGLSVKNNSAEVNFTEEEENILRTEDSGIESSLFADYKLGVFKNLFWTLGGRASHYSVSDQLYWSPRVQLNYYPSNFFQIKSSVYKNHQFLREISYENRIGKNVNYHILSDGDKHPIGSTTGYMLGASYKKKNWILDIELYHKDKQGVMEYALLRPGFQESINPPKQGIYRLFSGLGEVDGVDLQVIYEDNKYSGWLAYTLSKSIQRFTQILHNASFPSEGDRRHQLKWVNTYKLGRFSASANFVFSSGKPYTNIAIISSGDDRRFLRPEDRIARLPSYQRVDLSVFYDFSILDHRSSLGLTIFNVTDNDNVKYIQYVYSIPTDGLDNRTRSNVVGSEASLLGRSLNISFKIDFQ